MKLKEILELVRISACVISVMQKLRQGSGKLILVVLLGSSYEFFLLFVTFISMTLPDVVFCTPFLAILMQTRKFPANVLFRLETTIAMLIVTNPFVEAGEGLQKAVGDLVGDNKTLNLFYCN